MSPAFEQKYGIGLTDFTVEALNLPDDLRAILNKRREMDMMGDVGRYAQFQAVGAMRDAAKNTGTGGAFVGDRFIEALYQGFEAFVAKHPEAGCP